MGTLFGATFFLENFLWTFFVDAFCGHFCGHFSVENYKYIINLSSPPPKKKVKKFWTLQKKKKEKNWLFLSISVRCGIGAIIRIGLIVAMSEYIYIGMSPSHAIFLEASHWPPDLMISLSHPI